MVVLEIGIVLWRTFAGNFENREPQELWQIQLRLYGDQHRQVCCDKIPSIDAKSYDNGKSRLPVSNSFFLDPSLRTPRFYPIMWYDHLPCLLYQVVLFSHQQVNITVFVRSKASASCKSNSTFQIQKPSVCSCLMTWTNHKQHNFWNYNSLVVFDLLWNINMLFCSSVWNDFYLILICVVYFDIFWHPNVL